MQKMNPMGGFITSICTLVLVIILDIYGIYLSI